MPEDIEDVFFKSDGHKERFIAAMQPRIYQGLYDPEYSAAYYILTADEYTWEQAQECLLQPRGIDFKKLIKIGHFSGGYVVLIQWAANLFNGRTHVDPVELMRLDEINFRLAMAALMVRRYGVKE